MNVAPNNRNNPLEGKPPHVKPHVKGSKYYGLYFATHCQSLPALQQTAQSLLVSTDVYFFHTCVIIASPSCFSVSGVFFKKPILIAWFIYHLEEPEKMGTIRCSLEVIYIPVVPLELLSEDLKRLQKKKVETGKSDFCCLLIEWWNAIFTCARSIYGRYKSLYSS